MTKEMEKIKMVGATLTPEWNQMLVLTAVAEGVTKSDLLRRALSEWLTDNASEEALKRKVSERLQNEWRTMALKYATGDTRAQKAYENYILKKRAYLLNSGINEQNVADILSAVRYEQ